MATYKYKAKRLDGTTESGMIEAADRDTLIQRLRGEGLYVYEVVQKGGGMDLAKSTRISQKQIAFFCNQMSAMLKAGIPLARALSICQESAADKRLKHILGEVSERVHKGQAMSQAMQDMENLFPPFLIFMVETGEASGTLDFIMEKMARHYEQEVQLRGKIQTALIYPVILAVVAVLAVIFMLTVVLPQFMTMFADMELPVLTRMLLNLGDFLNHYGLVILFVLLLLCCLFGVLMTTERFRRSVDAWVLTIPLAGSLIKTIYTSRFAATFSILYGSGIEVLKCLDISGKVMGNSYVLEKLKQASVQLREGAMLSEALKQTGVFQLIFVSMVMIGEESGSLEQILSDTGEFYEREADTAISQLVALLEPMLIVIMGGVIGVVVLAIMLPIFATYGSMI